jgi:hypothetical protein
VSGRSLLPKDRHTSEKKGEEHHRHSKYNQENPAFPLASSRHEEIAAEWDDPKDTAIYHHPSPSLLLFASTSDEMSSEERTYEDHLLQAPGELYQLLLSLDHVESDELADALAVELDDAISTGWLRYPLGFPGPDPAARQKIEQG